jgi:hypothetical protein
MFPMRVNNVVGACALNSNNFWPLWIPIKAMGLEGVNVTAVVRSTITVYDEKMLFAV